MAHAEPITELSRAASTTALVDLLQASHFKNSLNLGEETIQQSEVAAVIRMIAAIVSGCSGCWGGGTSEASSSAGPAIGEFLGQSNAKTLVGRCDVTAATSFPAGGGCLHDEAHHHEARPRLDDA